MSSPQRPLPPGRVSPRRASYFSLSRQRNLTKRKATLLSAEFLGSEPKFAEPMARPEGAVPCTAAKLVSDPNNSPCGARFRRGPRKLAALKHARPLIRLKLRSSAHTEGGWGEVQTANTENHKDTPWRVLVGLCFLCLGICIRSTPSWLGRAAQMEAGSGPQLFEPKASSADPRRSRAAQVELLGSDTNFAAVRRTAPSGRAIGSANLGSDPKNSPDCGSPFLCLLSFGEAKAK